MQELSTRAGIVASYCVPEGSSKVEGNVLAQDLVMAQDADLRLLNLLARKENLRFAHQICPEQMFVLICFDDLTSFLFNRLNH